MKNKKTEDDQVLQKRMKVEIGFPASISIDLVQANELKHYEIFAGLGSLFSSAAVGFWVSHITTPNSILLASSLVFTVFTIIFGAAALYFRHKLNAGKIMKVMSVTDLT